MAFSFPQWREQYEKPNLRHYITLTHPTNVPSSVHTQKTRWRDLRLSLALAFFYPRSRAHDSDFTRTSHTLTSLTQPHVESCVPVCLWVNIRARCYRSFHYSNMRYRFPPFYEAHLTIGEFKAAHVFQILRRIPGNVRNEQSRGSSAERK